MRTSFYVFRLIFTRILGMSIGLILLCTSTHAQSTDPLARESVFLVVENPPEFPGGRQAMYDYLKRTVQYPSAADSAKIHGKVVVSFIVRRTGQLTNIEVVNGLGYGCDEEAIRAVDAMPRWQPGKQSGREQNVRHKIQVFFGVDYPQRDSNYRQN